MIRTCLRYGLWSWVLGLLWAFTSWAEPPALMHIDDIRPGMKGIGKTVFSGTTIEEFDVEVLDVFRGRSPRGDAIMARITGGPLPLEESGVLAGMSGSPIYIEGKLIGALAFIPSIFPKDTIVGITPIHEMIKDADRVRVQAEHTTNTMSPSWDGMNAAFQAKRFVPIQTPLVMSGFDPRVFAFAEEQLSPWGMMPVQGGSLSRAMLDEVDTELKPGSAVGVQLVGGDMNMSGIGTVTYRDGDKIVAFGHPMFFAGEVDFPMTSAYVHLAVPNLISSFKMASSTKVVGSIAQDRLTGISGMIGDISRTLPLDLSIHSDSSLAEEQSYHFDVIEHRQFTSLFMKIASYYALIATEKTMGNMTLHTRIRLEFRDSPPLVVEDLSSGHDGPISAVVGAFTPLDVLLGNRIEPIALEKVTLEIDVRNTMKIAEITGLRVRDHIVHPGEEIEATISLRPYGEEDITVTESISIPEDMPQGGLQLFACDSNVTSALEMLRAQAKYQPQSLAQLKDRLDEKVSHNTIVLSLFQMKPGAVIQGQELPAPPVSMMSLMSSTRRSSGKGSLTRGRVVTRRYVPTHYNITGCTLLELLVDGHMTGHGKLSTDTDNIEEEEGKEGE